MRIKTISYIKLFIPPIVLILLSKFKKIKTSIVEFNSTIFAFTKKSNILFVIGNGPSLLSSLDKHSKVIKSNDCLVVNSFATTTFYEELKPTLYVISDPSFFIGKNELTENLNQQVEGIVDAIVEKTQWELSLIIPYDAKSSDVLLGFTKNKFIRVYFYNRFNLGEFKTLGQKFDLWDRNLLAPPSQTVLNTCLYLALFWNYSETYLFGADSSWHEDWYLDQSTNLLYTNDKHFYNNKKTQLFRDSKGTIPKKLHEEMFDVGTALKEYWEIKEYADYKRLKIFNSSEKSWIDAFERKIPV